MRPVTGGTGRPMLWDGEVRNVRKRGPLVVGGASSIMRGMGLRGDRKVPGRCARPREGEWHAICRL
jgi:hypothetical protein